MVAEILIARHGETDWNLEGKWQGHTDVPLNVKGIQQAEKLAENLTDIRIDRIFSSDLKRARETARAVADRKGIDGVLIDTRLRERNLGSFEGLTSRQICDTIGRPYGRLLINDIGSNSTIEKWEDFSERVHAALLDIGDASYGGRSLVVSHGGVIMAISFMIQGNGYNPRTFNNGEFMDIIFKDGSLSVSPKSNATRE